MRSGDNSDHDSQDMYIDIYRGKYLTKELFRAVGRDPARVPAVLRVEECTVGGSPGCKLLSPHYVIYSTLEDRELLFRMGAVMEGAWGMFREVAPEVPGPGRPMECYLFETRSQWAAFTRQHTGDDAAVYLRPHGDGLLVGGYESNPRLYDMRMLPDDFQIRDLDLDRSVLERLTDMVRVQVPLPADVAVREHRGGLPTMTADGRPLLGPVPGVDGLLAAAGCCVGGVSISPAVGQALADLIQERLPASVLQPFSIGRFHPALQDDRLREACVDHYRNWYAEMPQTAIRAPST